MAGFAVTLEAEDFLCYHGVTFTYGFLFDSEPGMDQISSQSDLVG